MLEKFAQDTKHRYISSESDVLKKLLVTQSPVKRVADWRAIYHHVSNDLEKREYKAPGKLEEYTQYPHVDFEFLEKHLKDQKVGSPIDHFVEKVGKELIPEGYEPVLYFCGNLCENDCEAMVESLKKISPENSKQLFENMVGYFNKKSKPLDAQAIGEYIRELEFDEDKLPIIGESTSSPSSSKETGKQAEEFRTTDLVFAPESSVARDWTVETEKEFRQHPRIKQLKLEQDLPTQTRCMTIIKKSLDPDLMAAVVDYFPKETIDKLLKDPVVQDYYWKRNKGDAETKQDFIKAYLSTQGPWSLDVIKIINEV